MATLTADGINCSNGTLNGQYTGAAANNNVYPIGSILTWLWDGCSTPYYLNQTVTDSLFVSNNASFVAYYNFGGGGVTTLAGSWKTRGGTGSGAFALIQRFA